MEVTVTIKLNDGDAPDLLTRLAALLAAAPLEAESEPEPSAAATVVTEPRRRRRKDAALVPAADPAVTPATGPPATPLPTPSAQVVEFPTAAAPAADETVSAFDAILAAQVDTAMIEATTLTPDECRNGIKNLMIEHLGIVWARPNVLQPYGHLSKVPDADLPGLYAKAQADALALAGDAEVA